MADPQRWETRRGTDEPVSPKPYRCPVCGCVKLIHTNHVETVYMMCWADDDYSPIVGCGTSRNFEFDTHLAIVVLANEGKLP